VDTASVQPGRAPRIRIPYVDQYEASAYSQGASGILYDKQ